MEGIAFGGYSIFKGIAFGGYSEAHVNTDLRSVQRGHVERVPVTAGLSVANKALLF